MPRYIAFLRGINVGGHRVTMEELRQHFERLKFTDVATFIASGNVIFSARACETSSLEAKIENHLLKSLGYEVSTHLRTTADLAAVAAAAPFPAPEMDNPAYTVHVGFLREPASAALMGELSEARSTMDDFHVSGREFYWLCRGKLTESLVPWQNVSRIDGARATLRNLNTIRRLVARYPDA